MNIIKKFFSYKKVAVIYISCTMPYNRDIIHFSMSVKLYENKYGQRKSNYKSDEYPVSTTKKSKELITRFLAGQCTPEIPSYSKVIAGEEPVKISDVTSICTVV